MTNKNYLTTEEYQQLEDIKNWGINQNRNARLKHGLDNLNLGVDWITPLYLIETERRFNNGTNTRTRSRNI